MKTLVAVLFISTLAACGGYSQDGQVVDTDQSAMLGWPPPPGPKLYSTYNCSCTCSPCTTTGEATCTVTTQVCYISTVSYGTPSTQCQIACAQKVGDTSTQSCTVSAGYAHSGC